MKKKLINNKWFVLFFVSFTVLFYWFQIRPSRIRIYCSRYPDKVSGGRISSGQNAYLECLHGHGMEKRQEIGN
jgi:hypothetical protein